MILILLKYDGVHVGKKSLLACTVKNKYNTMALLKSCGRVTHLNIFLEKEYIYV